MQHAHSKDIIISYQVSGSGPPLLLVHGATADHTRWTPISPRFEEHFTVYAMDRRGRGGSGDTPQYHISLEAQDIAAVVEAIDTQPVAVLGHSYGALCSLEAALLTDRISRLVLYEPPLPPGRPPIPIEAIDRMQSLIDEGKNERALEVFFREVVRMPEEEFTAYRRLPVWKTRVSLAPTVTRELAIERTYRFHIERFADLHTPTLILLGGDSPPEVHQAMYDIDAALSNSKVVIMPGQQHIAMDTNPELFVSAVVHFLLGE